MTFNRRDLDNNDDDDFNFDDEFNFEDDKGGDDFRFDDEPSDVRLDDDDAGFGFEEEDMPDIEEEQGEGGGVSRTFIIIAAVMIVLFVIGLGALLLVVTSSRQPTSLELTSTAIAIQNATTVALLAQTETAAPLVALTQTAEAQATGFALTQTASVPTATPTIPPTETPIPTNTPDATQQAANALATQQSREMTQTAEALLFSPTPEPIDQSGVALTATALAILLAPGQGGGEPTQEIIATQPSTGPLPTALPDTGLFDDLAAGGNGLAVMAFMALGLVGVIVVSRRLRSTGG